jgi:hypothetical protein
VFRFWGGLAELVAAGSVTLIKDRARKTRLSKLLKNRKIFENCGEIRA